MSLIHIPEIDDDELRKELWKGCIPIVFNLNPNEITTLQSPPPYYLLAPRVSYFPLLTSIVQKHFLAAASVIVDELWLEYKGKPLKWQYPIGVLFDALGSANELPWNLIVHLQAFPPELIRCSSDVVVKSFFNNLLKEANFIKNEGSSKITDLSIQDTNDLWDGLRNHDYSTFWKANSKLQVTDISSLKKIPIRLFQYKQLTCTQVPVTPLDEKGTPKTLGNILIETLPQLEQSINDGKVGVVIQGIQPTLDTPITWLADNLSHPDSFLYIILKLSN